MKYVRFTDGSFVIIPTSAGHNEMIPRGKDVKSAGFCAIDVVVDKYQVKVWGKSHSLGVQSDERDAMEMSIALNVRG